MRGKGNIPKYKKTMQQMSAKTRPENFTRDYLFRIAREKVM